MLSSDTDDENVALGRMTEVAKANIRLLSGLLEDHKRDNREP